MEQFDDSFLIQAWSIDTGLRVYLAPLYWLRVAFLEDF